MATKIEGKLFGKNASGCGAWLPRGFAAIILRGHPIARYSNFLSLNIVILGKYVCGNSAANVFKHHYSNFCVFMWETVIGSILAYIYLIKYDKYLFFLRALVIHQYAFHIF